MEVDQNKPVHLVINPRCGYGGHHGAVVQLKAEARAEGVDLVEYVTKGPRDATDYVRGLAGEASAVVVWGGDGTVNEVVAGMEGFDTPILPCPAGTENLLAKELKIPSDPRKIVQVLRHGRIVNCDVGRINGRAFLLIIAVGFDGEVVRRLASTRSGHISHLSYFWPIWRTFWEHKYPRMKMIADGEEIYDDYGMAFIGNISRYAVGLRICRDALIDDGLLDLVVFSCRKQTGMLLHAAWTLLRMHPLKGNAIYKQFRHLRIETSEPVLSQVDGDPGPVTPIEISVSPHRVRLIVPPPARSWSIWPWKGEVPV
jgi:diacylglycerol kinase (ATP)